MRPINPVHVVACN
ncbi:hypothetical protein F383_37703 [Gossypium arboreum]|uniref:Uncharacterized protein n=1 Tax=Gossypium arboreum TaxID=29729 RepID=A0A0B0MHK1_GOSAR|nr:hypothetical protein F383_37703 [Gossypium arboreum]